YHLIKEQTKILVDALILSKSNYVVIYPNNDLGSEIILDIYKKKLSNQENFRIFSSIRFEKFLTLLKHANHLIGNSSAGLREAPFYGVPSIDIGTRQRGRLDGNKSPSVHHADYNTEKLVALIRKFFDNDIKYKSKKHFGDGKSRDRFLSICSRENGFWKTTIQKQFIDLD
ncbi:MAG: UDP-N-acetylglucosamine 2-epimerase, partial [bacterium]|nr:UDP-N-acetylglucosamine 2-epimerase [bacterium]